MSFPQTSFGFKFVLAHEPTRLLQLHAVFSVVKVLEEYIRDRKDLKNNFLTLIECFLAVTDKLIIM